MLLPVTCGKRATTRQQKLDWVPISSLGEFPQGSFPEINVSGECVMSVRSLRTIVGSADLQRFLAAGIDATSRATARRRVG
jgi:hypothetical protein